jgi:hypothetical protein
MAEREGTSTRNLLQSAFQRSWERPSSVKKLLVEYVCSNPLKACSNATFRRMDGLLKTSVGRDFTLITTSSVLFKVHSAMLIGSPKVLEDGVFPGGVTQGRPPAVVNLPSHHHPILVARFVNFLYASDYQFDPTNTGDQLKPSNYKFYTATHIPADDPPTPAVTALMGVRKHVFHIFMHALADELAYSALKAFAYDALISLLIINCSMSTSALKTVGRACKGDRGAKGG